ncbi:MAG: SIMPL domain-containing protein [Rickettsiales bacterium]|jgi:hypothetical protein|nr:SIMPL domain-containing protein [Rickettsiales bacterium]
MAVSENIEDKKRHQGKLAAAGLVCFGLLMAGFFPGYYYYKTYRMNNSVTVKGLAEMDVKADLAVWELNLRTAGNDFTATQKTMNRNVDLVLSFLKARGISEDEIKIDIVKVSDKNAQSYYGGDMDKRLRYIISQKLTVRSGQVDAVEKASSDTRELSLKGVGFEEYGNNIRYVFTSFSKVKPKMLEEAIKNAKFAADEFAKASGAKIGNIRKASQGVFSIRAKDSSEGSHADQYQEEQSINKKIRVVSTVEYWLD